MNSQPKQVPIWVENHGDQRYEVAVECIERGGDPLTSAGFALEPNKEESISADPIEEGEEYVVTITVRDSSEQKSISGGGLRTITVEIQTEDVIRIDRVDTEASLTN